MATILDVARRATVSPGTVSNVLSGKRPVSEHTRARVLAAMEELDWRPNLLARSLIEGRSRTVGFVTPVLLRNNPFYMEMAHEFEVCVRGRGYQLFLLGDPTDAGMLLERQVDGLLTLQGTLSLDQLDAFKERRIPIVLVLPEEPFAVSWLPSVGIDFRTAGAVAAAHFVELGHERMAVIAELPYHGSRLDGFRAQLERSGIALDPALVRASAGTPEAGYRAAIELLGEADRPTGIFATNDLTAIGVLGAAADLHIRVPDELSVIGLDNILLSAHVRPSLTTIAIPYLEIAEEATTLLVDLIDHGKLESSSRAWQPKIIVRQSTGPPRSGRMETRAMPALHG